MWIFNSKELKKWILDFEGSKNKIEFGFTKFKRK